MEFCLKKSEISDPQAAFDKIKIRYYDEKNKIHESNLISIDQCWREGKLDRPKEWIMVGKRN